MVPRKVWAASEAAAITTKHRIMRNFIDFLLFLGEAAAMSFSSDPRANLSAADV
jgi:hypothetical protein